MKYILILITLTDLPPAPEPPQISTIRFSDKATCEATGQQYIKLGKAFNRDVRFTCAKY
jgi:hypothetical protein